MLIINECVSFGTDLFNHSKGLFFNRALDKLSECQYNMSFHVQKWLENRKKRKGKKGRKKERKKKKSQNKRKREKEGGKKIE